MITTNGCARTALVPLLAAVALLAMACSKNAAAPNNSCLDAGMAGSVGASGSGGAGASGSAGTTGVAGTGGGGAGTMIGAAGSAGGGAGVSGGGVTGSGGAGRDGGADATDSGSAEVGTPSCAPKPGGNLCTSIPRFSGTQVVDGVGDEFCNVPATIHAFKNGVTLNGSKPPPLPDVLVARVAWDAVGIHAHFHVDDSEILGQDGIQFDIGGQFPLAGFFDGVSQDLGLINIGLGVKQTGTALGFPVTIPASAGMSFQGNQTQCVPSPCDHTPKGLVSFGQPLVAPAQWAYRDVTGGYEWELLLPWSILGRSSPPLAGTAVAAELALNDQNSRLFAQSFLSLTPLPNGTGSQCTTAQAPNPDPTKLGTVTNVDPSCDDRSWCSPTLE